LKRVLAFTPWIAALMLLGGVACRVAAQPGASDENSRKALAGDSIYQLNSAWADQDGKPLPLSRFRGKPLVLAMMYTNCKDVCPLIISDMQKIEATLPPLVRDKVGFALFSFDPEQDSPLQLKQYASAHSLDTKRWTLLTSSPDSVRMLAAVLGIRYKKDLNGDFAHSSVITVLDSQGAIRHQQTGVRKDPALIADILNGLLNQAK
jgi:protein SCO1/2